MSREKDPIARGLEAAYGKRSVLDLLAEKTGLDTRISVAPDVSSPMLKPLALGASASAGKYQLQGEIARGGVGTVLKGYDTHLGRDVALKLLHEGYVNDPELLQRFVEEAQIGGQLQHPGIVPVYDLGMQEGRPFFSMKLVKGRTLAALLEEREHPGAQRRRFLAIFEQVCLTMSYAHARGVIHRDLKPANVMVGAFGEVQVVDWGMGKVLGRTDGPDEARANLSVIATVRSEKEGSQSVVGSVMGTPSYMPPEQALGDVDRMNERSDVFSLGAVLCRILTGAPPYVGHNLIDMAARADLDACHQRLDACDADEDLKQLVRQCLSPAPQARPKDASVLAEHIGGHLAAVEGRTKQAQVAAAEQRVKAHAARRAQKLTLGLAASVLLAVALGGGGLWWLEKTRAARVAEAGRAVGEALADARVAYGRARHSTKMERWHAALAAAKQAQSLAEANEVAHNLRDSAHNHLAEVTRGHVSAQKHAEQLANEERTLAKLEAIPIPPEGDYFAMSKAESRRRDQAYRRVLGEPDALDLPDLSQPERWAAALDDWAFADYVLEGTKRKQLLDLANTIDPDPRRMELRGLLVTKRFITADLRRLADKAQELAPMTAITLAALLASRWEHRLAVTVLHDVHERHLDHYLVALRLSDNAGMSRQPKVQLRFGSIAAALRPDSSSAWFLQGRALFELRRYKEAEACHRRAITYDPESAGAHHNLAHALEHLGRYEEALASLREAARLNPDDAGTHTCLGTAFHRLDRHTEGSQAWLASKQILERTREKALTVAQQAIHREPESAQAHASLGDALSNAGRAKEALESYRKAVGLDPNNAWYEISVGATLAGLKRVDEAVPHFRKALGLDPNHARALVSLANCYLTQGSHKEALKYLSNAVKVRPRDTRLQQALGNHLVRMGRLDDALATYLGALRQDPKLGWVRQAVATVLWQQGKREEAVEVLRETVRHMPRFAAARSSLAFFLKELGRPDEAIQTCREGLALIPDIQLLLTLGRIYFLQKKHDDAMAAWRKAIQINPETYMAHHNLGRALIRKGADAEADKHLKEAVRLAPEEAWAQYNLGWRLNQVHRYELAVVAYRKAIELNPQMAQAHCNLGSALRRLGRYREALPHYIKGHEVGSKQPGWKHPSGKWVESARKRAEREPRLEGILALEIDPRDGKEADYAVTLGYRRKEYAQVVALVRALRVDEYSAKYRNYVRYNGACSAALVSANEELSAERRAELRALALKWLRAELATSPTRKRLEHWLKDKDFKSVRDVEPLPAGFESFWREVRKALETAK